MSKMTTIVCAAALAGLAAPGHAGDFRYGVIRYGNTSGWLYDNRDDHRDLPSNGVFPGNFATQPFIAWIGAAGFAGSTPERSMMPYPSQVVFGNVGQRWRGGPKNHLGPHALRRPH